MWISLEEEEPADAMLMAGMRGRGYDLWQLPATACNQGTRAIREMKKLLMGR